MTEEQLFVQQLNKHQNIVHKVCRLYVDTPDDREDLFQEITLQAWKAYQNFRGDAKFSTWLYRVALNTAITYFKKDQKQAIFTSADQLPEVIEYNNPIEEQVKAMYTAIGSLNKIDKALVMLYLED
ncbi:MAG: RNA polymerase sigma factor, partial [Chitinophagaceae bacterium]